MRKPGGYAVGNLPAEVSSFVGRQHELNEVQRLLAVSRLVTLTGVGGAGKTRLALRTAAESRRAFGDGTWYIDLSELRNIAELRGSDQVDATAPDPDALGELVRATLGLPERIGNTPLRTLAGQLAGWKALLVLDNCEHLLSASTVLADSLLRSGPNLKILATSREPLSVSG